MFAAARPPARAGGTHDTREGILPQTNHVKTLARKFWPILIYGHSTGGAVLRASTERLPSVPLVAEEGPIDRSLGFSAPRPCPRVR
jgi:hypothetical protein